MIFQRNASLWLATLQSLLLLAAGFGVQITTDQQGLVMGAAGAVASLVTGAAIRTQVYSEESHRQALRAAYNGSGQ
jgi:hypothetical protein